MPSSVRDAFAVNADGEAGVELPEGRVWPKPTAIRCSPGDGVIVLWSTPHAPTYVTTDEPRLMVGVLAFWPLPHPLLNEAE